jgi:hypothetical protein
MFQYATEERELNDLKSVLRDYYKKKLDDATDKMWQEGVKLEPLQFRE